MKLAGEKRVRATPQQVWDALLTVDVLQAAVPGCECVTTITPLKFTATTVVKVGPIKARFSGEIEVLDCIEAVSCRLVGQGNGGVAGFAQGEASIVLTPQDGETILSYDAEVKIGGKISSLGDRLFKNIAEKNIEAFFISISKHFAAPETAQL